MDWQPVALVRAQARNPRVESVRARLAPAKVAVRVAANAVIVAVIGASGGLAGCSGQGTFLTGGPTVGQLKASLSHLEFENEQLKRSVAKLERENRSIEDHLVQERIDNGDLAARLDDARNLLRERGVDADLRVGSRRQDDTDGGSVSDPPRSRVRARAPAPSTKVRKPPFAQISGHIDPVPSAESQDGSEPARRTGRSSRTRSKSGDQGDPPDQHSYNNPKLEWLPVADGSSNSSSAIR